MSELVKVLDDGSRQICLGEVVIPEGYPRPLTDNVSDQLALLPELGIKGVAKRNAVTQHAVCSSIERAANSMFGPTYLRDPRIRSVQAVLYATAVALGLVDLPDKLLGNGNKLSDRQLDVIALAASGFTRPLIEKELRVTSARNDTHQARVALGITNSPVATLVASQLQCGGLRVSTEGPNPVDFSHVAVASLDEKHYSKFILRNM